MSHTVDEHLVNLAGDLAEASGEVIRRYFRQPFDIEQKGDDSPVTIADRGAEQAIRTVLEKQRPQDGIVGEEYGTERPDAEFVWVIDPIDGTRSFVIGRPVFGTLISLLKDGSPVLGVIDQPILGERWIGGDGRPTEFNGEPARVRACTDINRAHMATTSPHQFQAADRDTVFSIGEEAASMVYGDDCYNYAGLASGWIDAVIEDGLKLHDFAALAPVVTGAGGTITDWGGNPLTAQSSGDVLASGDKSLHEILIKRLGRA
ncbi:MAG: histidinol-phosphatase [Pseudomonadota bacterium]